MGAVSQLDYYLCLYRGRRIISTCVAAPVSGPGLHVKMNVCPILVA